MTVAEQTQVSYTWDNANRLTGVTRGSSSVELQYDNANRRTQLTLPNRIVVAYSYDSDSRVSGMIWTLAGNQIGDLEYSYDADGRVIEKTGSMAPTNLPQPVAGNTFNADNEVTAFNGTAMAYDANGNLTNDGTNTYSWDARNHLSAIAGPVTASFVYGPFGRRMSKTINGTATSFLYDGLNPVQELQNGSPSANMLTRLGIDEYFQRTDSTSAADLLTDALGSTLALADTTRTVQTSYTYEPFGTTTASGVSGTNPFQFTGRENDGAGLYYYRDRYYGADQQRFVSQDPFDILFGGWRLYTYASDDPVNFLDPLGLYSCFYSIRAHRIVCVPTYPQDPLFESNNFASGAPGSCRNNAECTDESNVGPITPHDYTVGPNIGPGNKMGRHLSPVTPLKNGRSGFEIHLWGRNLGCIMTHLNTGDLLNHDLDLEEGNNSLQVNP